MTLLVCAMGADSGFAAEPSQTSCLSLSPFRAVQSLRGAQTGFAESLRDQVLAELKSEPDSLWVFHPAGGCPPDLAVLDAFQKPEDLVSTPQGNSLRFRLEWRQIQGTTEFFLPLPAKQLPPAASIAQQLRAVASQMLSRVEVRSKPDSVTFRVISAAGRLPSRITPSWIQVPPGPFSLEFQKGELVRRRDTLLGSGGLYQIEVDLRPNRVEIPPEVVAAGKPRRTWPAWAVAGLALAGSAWATYHQEEAQKAYSSLGPQNPPESFERDWTRLREANQIRNTCLVVTLVLATGAGWLEWDSSH